jgi:hypothetical protein
MTRLAEGEELETNILRANAKFLHRPACACLWRGCHTIPIRYIAHGFAGSNPSLSGRVGVKLLSDCSVNLMWDVTRRVLASLRDRHWALP